MPVHLKENLKESQSYMALVIKNALLIFHKSNDRTNMLQIGILRW